MALLISVPAKELRNLQLRSSVFPIDLLLAAPISDSLRTAALIVRQSSASKNMAVSVLVRPEIFTHGASLDWLRSRTEEVTEHIHLSDGSTIKTVPGLRNHLFVYNVCSGACLRSLIQLIERAPELGSGLHSQINSGFLLRNASSSGDPPPAYIMSPRSEIAENDSPPLLYSAYFNRHSVEDSLNRILEGGTVDKPDWDMQIKYFVATEAALLDRHFVLAIALAVETAFFTSQHKVLIALPSMGNTANFRDRAGHLVSQLFDTKLVLPRVRSESVLLCDAEVSENWFAGRKAQLVSHDSFPFWNHTQDYYKQFSALELFATDGLTDVDRSVEVIHALTGFTLTGRVHIRTGMQ